MSQDDVDRFLSEGGFEAREAAESSSAKAKPEKKRKNDQDTDAVKKPKVQENRAVYVTNLPRDTNEVEIFEVFRRYGIIDQGADEKHRIKMYSDDEGNFNGEALIVYFKRGSIELAIQMMDDNYFRIEEQQNGTVGVKEADFSYKRNKDSAQIVSKLTRKDKKVSERNRADLNRKLAEWSDNEEEIKEVFAPKKNKWNKVVILKYIFTLEELDEDPAAYFEIKEDIEEEAGKHGSVNKVALYDKEVDGIVSVHFREFEGAEAFRAASHGRNFDCRKIEATIADDRPKFRKSGRAEENSSDEERLERAVHG